MKCGTRTCTTNAAYRVHWPGSPICLCRSCADRAKRIVDVMGFALSVDPLAPDAVVVLVVPATSAGEPPWPLCTWPGGCLAAADAEGGRCAKHREADA